MTPGRKGRTTLLTDKPTLKLYLDALRLGLPQKDAAVSVGWTEASVISWKATAEEALQRGGKLTIREKECADFLAQSQKAVAACKQGHLAVITRAAQTDRQWTASAWVLERRWPREFGRQLVEVSGPDGGPIEVEERITGLLEAVRAARAASNGHAKVTEEVLHPTNGSGS